MSKQDEAEPAVILMPYGCAIHPWYFRSHNGAASIYTVHMIYVYCIAQKLFAGDE
jgi:hypothetical protein